MEVASSDPPEDGVPARYCLRHTSVEGATALGVRAELLDAVRRAGPELIIELSSVLFVDSTGLEVLLEVMREARRAGVRLRFVDPQPAVARLIAMTGMDRILEEH